MVPRPVPVPASAPAAISSATIFADGLIETPRKKHAGAPKEFLQLMSSTKSKLRVTSAFAALAALALAVSCTGFFVNPTLTSLAIGPTSLPLAPSQTYQMVATGTFSDGSTQTVTSKCVWTSTDPSVATIGTNSGIVTASSSVTTVGTTTIGASDGAISATTSATVTVCPVVTNLTIKASASSGAPNSQITFTATADVGSQSGVDVTDIVTWNVGDSSVLTISGNTGTLVGTDGQSTTVTATLCNVPSTNTLTISVS